MERAAAIIPPGWKPAASPVVDRLYSLRLGGASRAPGVRNFNLLYDGILPMVRTLDPDEVFAQLEYELEVYVAENARRRVFVHAGVVAWRGRAIVLPGRSHSGKSTLVAELVRAGATYYTDEYAVFDARGRIHPYPRPLLIREEGRAYGRRCPPEAFGGRTGVRPIPVGMIAVSEYRTEARWRPRPLSSGRAALALLAHTVPARSRPAAALAAIRQATSGATAVKGRRGEAAPTAEAILQQADW
jgi:hypothetical protein